MEFKGLLRAARRRWLSIVAMLLLGLIVGGAVTYLTPKQYESSAKVFVSVDTQVTAELFTASAYVQNRANAYAELANHRSLMSRVIDEAGLDFTPSGLSDQVRAEVETLSSIITLTVRDDDPEQAQRIALAVAQQFVVYVEELETPRGTTRPQVNAAITDPPLIQLDPVVPRTTINFVAAGVIGLLLGIGLAATREVLDNTVKSSDDVAAATNAPIVATVGQDRAIAKAPLLTDVRGFSPRSEAFRLLRTNLQYVDLDRPAKSLVVTSAVAGEGKTHTATNLAIALAQAGQRVIIVDGDLRRPRVAERFGLDRSIGVTTVLVGRTTLEESIQVHAPSGAHCLASGPTPPNPTEILQTAATKELLARLIDTYDVVIIDAPPVLPVADAAILGAIADGTIVVARYGKTRQEELTLASERIAGVGGRLFGTVVNMVPKRAAESYAYYYYYEEDPVPGRRSADRSESSSDAGSRTEDRERSPRRADLA